MRATHLAAALGGGLLHLGLCFVVSSAIGARLAKADSEAAKPDPVAVGYDIFNREWMPNDPRSHGGDGLGPVYNDSSCVACHNSGGSGGAGPASKNVDILSASRNRTQVAIATAQGLANVGQAQARNGSVVPPNSPASLDPL